MRYLVDTSVLIAYQRNVAAALIFINTHDCLVSAIAMMEFDQSELVQSGIKPDLKTLFSSLEVLPFTAECAKISAKEVQKFRNLRTEKGKRAIADSIIVQLTLDTMIAATALQHRLTLAHNNAKDFRRYESLKKLQITD